MDPLAQWSNGDHLQAGLLPRLAGGGFLAGLARFDFARRELPRELALCNLSPYEQYSTLVNHNGPGNATLRLSIATHRHRSVAHGSRRPLGREGVLSVGGTSGPGDFASPSLLPR